MTKREGAIIAAHTGTMLCEMKDLLEYLEELFTFPIMHHQVPELEDVIKEKSKNDYMDIIKNLT